MVQKISKGRARSLWIKAQRLDSKEPFGRGPGATRAAIEHLGYVQIDTINVIERCHHHILFSRIPKYSRSDLYSCQSKEKSIFEYWTHALAYVPTRDYRYFIPRMDQVEQSPSSWFSKVKKADFNRVISRIQNEGALSLRDMRDKKLEDKDHPWASRKPSQRALQLGFHSGKLTVSERIGMLKKYELSSRHFDWNKRPKAASELEVLNYTLDRALRSQAVVSLDSICHLNTKIKPKINRLIESMVSSRELIELSISGIEATKFWIRPEIFAQKEHLDNSLIHILSPFDPLVIQRRRLKLFFDYEHRFEAYLPKEKRVFGYFGLPILFEDRIVAVIDLKTDRCRNKLDIQKWTWVGDSSLGRLKKNIEERLHYFELFQLS